MYSCYQPHLEVEAVRYRHPVTPCYNGSATAPSLQMTGAAYQSRPLTT